MVKRMLIDATHPEETRVVVMDGTRLEEFDVETSTKKQNKGNIYLAKVVRVEPSLQAAFVDYGGNRHGFLAFSEIHPDYYQIPVADRERLLAEVQQHVHEDDDHHHADDHAPEQPDHDHPSDHHDHDHSHDHDHGHDHAQGHDHSHEQSTSDVGVEAIPTSDLPPTGSATEQPGAVDAQLSFLAPSVSSAPIPDETADETTDENVPPPAFVEPVDAAPSEPTSAVDERGDVYGSVEGAASDEAYAASMSEDASAPTTTDNAAPSSNSDDIGERGSQVEDVPVEERPVDTVGGDEENEDGDDAEEDEDSKRRRRFLASRHYKIQEVIKRRQIMLVQVVKEERGNKGAALTTYLSLAGRYCVLMPNSARGGGVSRKITNATDRRRLKSIMAELQPPKTAAVILRTAGAERSKPEIKRDYEYLMRTWDVIRENTLQSRAPALIHEEGNLIKRAIRDVYSKDIEDIMVEGEDGYKTAKDFMRMLTPSHSKKVQRYGDTNISLFQRYQVETQLEAINTPVVQLRSGGSIVFGQTEALVAIDVNSGRATRERHIEETALKTNVEAADEIARQLRLRDLAGLVVIDFIDMEENRNNHAVERRLKEALKQDRARIQVGRISHFGLLELSRQRLRPSLIETNFRPCTACAGTGLIRSTESSSIYALRMIEEEGIRRRSSELTVTVNPDVALYLLNYKREQVATLEARYGIRIFVLGDAHLIQPNLRIDRVKATRLAGDEGIVPPVHVQALPAPEPEVEVEEDVEIEEEETTNVEEVNATEGEGQDGSRGGRGRRRRRRRGRGRDEPREGGPREGGPREPREHGARDQAPRAHEPSAERGPQLDNADPAESVSTAGEGAAASEEGAGTEGEQAAREERGGRRRRRGRRGGRRRRRDGTEFPNQGAEGEQGEAEGPQSAEGDAQPESSSADTPQPAEAIGESDAPVASGSRRRGFFSAVKEAALSWTRNDDAPEATPSSPQVTQAPPAIVEVPPPAPAPAPQAFVPAPAPVTPPPPAPQAAPAPPPPPPAPVVEEAPSGPPKRGWWSEPKA